MSLESFLSAIKTDLAVSRKPPLSSQARAPQPSEELAQEPGKQADKAMTPRHRSSADSSLAPLVPKQPDPERPDPEQPPHPTVEVLRRLELPVALPSEREWTPAPFTLPAQKELPSPNILPRPTVASLSPLSNAAALSARALTAPLKPTEEKPVAGHPLAHRLIVGQQRLLPVPDGIFLWQADYVRDAGDLIVRSDLCDTLIVRHFFAADVPPDLVTLDGLRLEADMAYALAQTFGKLKLPPGTPAPACVTRLAGPAAIKRPGEARIDLALGNWIELGSLVETGPGGTLSLSFGQCLRIDLASATRLRLDCWSSFSSTSGPILELTLLTGAFVSVAAMSGVPPLVSMRTPYGTLSWCDASVAGQIALEGAPTMVALLHRASGIAGMLTVVNGWGTAYLTQNMHVLTLRGHGPPGDVEPLTARLLKQSAFGVLLPSQQREETLKTLR